MFRPFLDPVLSNKNADVSSNCGLPILSMAGAQRAALRSPANVSLASAVVSPVPAERAAGGTNFPAVWVRDVCHHLFLGGLTTGSKREAPII